MINEMYKRRIEKDKQQITGGIERICGRERGRGGEGERGRGGEGERGRGSEGREKVERIGYDWITDANFIL